MRKSGFVDQQLLKTANRQQQNIDNVILLVENSDIMLGILHEFKPLNKSETLKTVMSEFFFGEGFLPGHVIITTIIIRT